MANKRIAMQYDVKQNLVKNSKMFGKWYAQPVINNTLNLKGFAQHIASHNGTYKTSTIKGVIEEMVECLGEMVMQGVGVKLDGLGTFYPTFEGTGSLTLENYDVNTFVRGIHIRFLPENAKDEELTSRKFMSKCVLKRRFPVSTSTTENED